MPDRAHGLQKGETGQRLRRRHGSHNGGRLGRPIPVGIRRSGHDGGTGDDRDIRPRRLGRHWDGCAGFRVLPEPARHGGLAGPIRLFSRSAGGRGFSVDPVWFHTAATRRPGRLLFRRRVRERTGNATDPFPHPLRLGPGRGERTDPPFFGRRRALSASFPERGGLLRYRTDPGLPGSANRRRVRRLERGHGQRIRPAAAPRRPVL